MVHADTREHTSRWYPGAGIYRKVGMRLVDPIHIPVWGLYVTTPEVSEEKAKIHTTVEVENASDSDHEVIIEVTIVDPSYVELISEEIKLVLKPGEKLPVEFNDAHAALRGYAESNLSSSIIFSAGMNPRLYSYIAQFEDFFPNKSGVIKKKIVLKVSDYRSALIQGKFLAKKPPFCEPSEVATAPG